MNDYYERIIELRKRAILEEVLQSVENAREVKSDEYFTACDIWFDLVAKIIGVKDEQ